MAAYRRVEDLVTCGLTACTPGSTPGPVLGNEYERTFLLWQLLQKCPKSQYHWVLALNWCVTCNSYYAYTQAHYISCDTNQRTRFHATKSLSTPHYGRQINHPQPTHSVKHFSRKYLMTIAQQICGNNYWSTSHSPTLKMYKIALQTPLPYDKTPLAIQLSWLSLFLGLMLIVTDQNLDIQYTKNYQCPCSKIGEHWVNIGMIGLLLQTSYGWI